jgi:mannose-6-phosphate isomerase
VIDLLECSVMPYAWGSRTAIAELTGRPSPSDGPEAELWMGAHPAAPSRLARDGEPRSLVSVIEEDPQRELGAAVVRRFGARLPFLVKVLAAAQPLSIQAHPDAAQARAGFEDEERRGVPRDAPHRNYKDPGHKPELLCALTPFDALCGFRDLDETLRLFDELAVPALDDALAPLRRARDLSATFHAVMTTLDPAAVGAVVEACAARGDAGAFGRELGWATRLAALYPGDPGVVSALFLNLVHLEPGQAIYLGAGNLHAYLGGTGVEIMASSDNVLRGGLTPKHVDVPELMRVLDFAAAGPVRPRTARPIDEVEAVYDVPAPDFRLAVLRPGGRACEREPRGPEILLCTEGALRLSGASLPSAGVKLPRGRAAFVSAETDWYRLEGAGTAYRAYCVTE